MGSSILLALSVTSLMKTILFVISQFWVEPTQKAKEDHDQLEQEHRKILKNERFQNGDDGKINCFVSNKQPASDVLLQRSLVILMEPSLNFKVFFTLGVGEPISCLLGRVTIRGTWKQDYMVLKIMSSPRSLEARERESKYLDCGFRIVIIIIGDATRWANVWISAEGRSVSTKKFSEDTMCRVNPALYAAMAVSSDFGLKMVITKEGFAIFFIPALSKFPHNTSWEKG